MSKLSVSLSMLLLAGCAANPPPPLAAGCTAPLEQPPDIAPGLIVPAPGHPHPPPVDCLPRQNLVQVQDGGINLGGPRRAAP